MKNNAKSKSTPRMVAGQEPRYSFTGRKFSAKGMATLGGFLVFAGAQFAPMSESFKHNKTYSQIRSMCEEERMLDEHDVLVRDCIFKSVSQAASVVAGAIVSGRTAWKAIPAGKSLPRTYAEIADKAARIEARRKAAKGDAVVYAWDSDDGWHHEYRGHRPAAFCGVGVCA